MQIEITEPATSLQSITIKEIEVDEVPILASILELLDLQNDYYKIHKYYANKCRELTIFDKIRKEDN